MMAGIKVGRAWSAVGVLILAILMISATKASACFVVGVASPTATTAVTTEFDGDAHLRGGDQIHGPNASAGMGRQGRERPGGFRDEHAASWSGVAAGDAVAAVPRLAVEYVYDGGAASYDASARLVDVRTVVHVDGAGRPTNAMSLRRQSGAVLHGSVSVSGFGVAAKAVPGPNGALRDVATGRFAANPATATAARSSSVHGNSLASTVPTTLYRRVTSGGDFQKWGISGNLKGRYTSTELGTDQLIPMTSGGRFDMVNLERWLVRNDPGPMNLEPWAGR